MNKRISCLLVLVSMLLVFCHEDILYAKSDGGTLLKDLYLKDEDQDIISSDEMLIQKNLVSLNQKIMSEMMTVDCAGEESYIDSYAGSYIKDNKLTICVTDKFEGKKISDDLVEYKVVDFSYNELLKKQAQIMADFEVFCQRYQDGKEAELLDSFVGVGIDDQRNTLVIDVIDITDQKIETFKKIFSIKDDILFQEVEEPVNDEATYKPGRAIYVAVLNGSEVKTYRLSIGYRAYLNASSGRKNGFTTCAHAIKDSSDGNVYTSSACSTIIGMIEKWKYSGSVDAAFVELKSGNSMSMVTHYSNSQGSTSGGDTIKNDSIVQSIAQGATVYKVGSTTYKTSAIVQSTNYSFTVKNEISGTYSTFTNLVKTSKFTDSGDSGGLVYQNINGNNVPAGLVKGSTATSSVYVKAYEVLNQMNVVPY